MFSKSLQVAIAVIGATALLSVSCRAADDKKIAAETIIAKTIRPLMERQGIPGMAVGIVTAAGNWSYFYGVASKTTGNAVTGDTLFEIGSLSKTFTATLASYAAVTGHLALSDHASKYFPSLQGSSFDKISILNLGTHTSGGLPLQVPDQVANDRQLMDYFKTWTPAYAAGAYRQYSNPGIGLFGMISAKSLNGDFSVSMQRDVFRPLGLDHSFIDVPAAQMAQYAQGYTKTDNPIRMTPGPAAAPAYGIRTTVGDVVRFVAANMQMIDLHKDLQRAIVATHTGYFRVGPMTQDLVWEQYAYPVELKDLLEGSSAKITYEANAATKIDPPLSPKDDAWINKTGSTNGFASYAAFIPGKKIGIVLLSNKNYPIDARVTAAYEILMQLDAAAPATNRK